MFIRVAAHVLHEIAALLAELLVAAVADRAERGRRGVRPLLLGDVPIVAHLAQHIIAAVERALGRTDRVVIGGSLGQDRKICRLGQRQLGDVLVEVGARRGLDAIGVAAEEDRIQVKLENLLLAQRRFEAECEDRLADLAADIVARILQQIFGDLLGDGGSAPRTPPASHGLGCIVADRSDQTDVIEPAMGEEGLVLGGDKRIADQRREFVVGQLDPPLASERLDGSAVIATDVGWERRLVGEQGLRGRKAAGEIYPDEREHSEQAKPAPCSTANPAALPPGIDLLVHPLVEGDEVRQRPFGDSQTLEFHSNEALDVSIRGWKRLAAHSGSDIRFDRLR